MPKFNEFIKGFEEKETATKPQEPKENRDQIIEKVNQKMMNAGTYGAFGDKENYEKSIAEAEELRKGLAPKAEEPKGKEQVRPNPNKQEEPKAPKYKLSSYFGKNYSGLESSQELDDDIENAIWDKTMKGNFVEVEEPETGKKWRFSPDIKDPYDIALDERFEYGRPAPKAQTPAPQKQEENVAKQESVPQQKSDFNPSEPIEEYNDSYDAITHSEREFNVETSNDSGMYEYVKKNLPTLKKLAETNPEGVIRAITRHGNYPASFYGIEPKNVRKEYVQAVLNGFLED